MTLNKFLLGAALVMTLTTFVHVFLGGPEIYGPVRASDLPEELRAVLSVIWHAISLFLAIVAAALFWVANHRNRALEVLIFATCFGFVMLFIGYGLADLGTLMIMPQWIIFGVICGLVALSWRPARRAVLT